MIQLHNITYLPGILNKIIIGYPLNVSIIFTTPMLFMT